ncbi:IclR family transcriptional regulator [Caldinitratiruptor microaerophilus]|uniref:IclR family transcriptional regulator n=1 Tax=Caldinitratiruptor microaerophilus TaxID=671077 RepID=A0AA35CK38_9FIRM|nr:IclR family transcriptional regulator [Caldinitratiruptor microaerophilus]BDG58962.1 IclR family transcriptional regulator [Caldinitratiruptor microaerophilus]
MRKHLSQSDKDSLASLERGLQILFALERFPEGLTAAEIAAEAGIPASTVYRYLRKLSAWGLVTSTPGSSRYWLGNRLLSLAGKVPAERELVAVARPHMTALSRRLEETVLLTQVSGHEAICLERVESRQVVRLSFDRGVVLPLHAGASARVLMAYLEPEEVDAVIRSVGLPRYTENTITDPDRLKAVLQEVRERGYAISDEEMDRGVRSISMPVRDPEGRVVAGMCVVGPRFRLGDERVPEILSALREATDAVTRDLAQRRAGPVAPRPDGPPARERATGTDRPL